MTEYTQEDIDRMLAAGHATIDAEHSDPSFTPERRGSRAANGMIPAKRANGLGVEKSRIETGRGKGSIGQLGAGLGQYEEWSLEQQNLTDGIAVNWGSGGVAITFPRLPYRELHTNYRKSNFWAHRARVAKQARTEARVAVLGCGPCEWNANGLRMCNTFVRCEITETFYAPTMRRLDIEGLMAACKSWIDGLVDAGLIEDDDWRHVIRLSGNVLHLKGSPKTVITVKELRRD